jgi:hypothetical protein
LGGYTIDKAEDVVHKAQEETVTGKKRFTANPEVKNASKSRTENDENWMSAYRFVDKDDKPTGEVSAKRWVNDANQHILLYTCTEDDNGDDEWHEVLNGYWDSTNNVNTIVSGVFSGTATSALWADLAEKYESDEQYPAGTLIKFGGEKDITIAHFGENCNGVISEKPGYLLDSDLENGLPVALAGKTPVRVIGKVNNFDRLVRSSVSGVATVKTSDDEKVIAIALEASDNEEEKLVKCVTKFNLD